MPTDLSCSSEQGLKHNSNFVQGMLSAADKHSAQMNAIGHICKCNDITSFSEGLGNAAAYQTRSHTWQGLPDSENK